MKWPVKVEWVWHDSTLQRLETQKSHMEFATPHGKKKLREKIQAAIYALSLFNCV